MLGRAVIGFRAVDKTSLKEHYQPVVAALLTATALVVGDHSPDLDRVTEGILLTLQDGRILYSMTLQGGAARATTARGVTERDAASIGSETQRLLENPQMSHPSRLLVDALCRQQDRLESFLLAWASLEMLINKHTSGFEAGDWIPNVPREFTEQARKLHADFETAKHKYYSLRERLLAFGLTRLWDS